jgi:hypothetical protein
MSLFDIHHEEELSDNPEGDMDPFEVIYIIDNKTLYYKKIIILNISAYMVINQYYIIQF